MNPFISKVQILLSGLINVNIHLADGTTIKIEWKKKKVFVYFLTLGIDIISYLLMLSMDNISSNWLYICNRRKPFSVVLNNCVSSSYSNTCFSNRTVRYSFSWAYDRNALYIILVFVAPPLAASRINATISVLLLYFITMLL